MKSKIREIRVSNRTFLWRVVPTSPNYVCVRIWNKGEKRRPWLQVRCRFDDPWLHFGELISGDPQSIKKYFRLDPITPRLVQEFITTVAQEFGWPAGERPAGDFELNSDGKLLQIEDAGKPGPNPF